MGNPIAKIQISKRVPGEDYQEYRWTCIVDDGSDLIPSAGEASTVAGVFREVQLQVEMYCEDDKGGSQ